VPLLGRTLVRVGDHAPGAGGNPFPRFARLQICDGPLAVLWSQVGGSSICPPLLSFTFG
jgi:hypothetical protein